MTTLTTHNVEDLSDSDFNLVVLENIRVAMRQAIGDKTKYSKSGQTIIFAEPYRLDGRADLAELTRIAVAQAEKAGLEYRNVPRVAVEELRAERIAKAYEPDVLAVLFTRIDNILIRAELARVERLEKAVWDSQAAEKNERIRSWNAKNQLENDFLSNPRHGISYPQLSEIFGRRDDTGVIHVLYVADGCPVTCLDAPVKDANDDESVRYEHPQGIVLTESDAAAVGIIIE